MSHGKASAYLPVVELLNNYFGIAPHDDARKRREKIAGKTLMLDRALEDALPYIFALLAVEETPGALAQMDAQIRRRRTLDAIKRLLLRESLSQPLIIIFEDLHWIDSETQALLDLLADGLANTRVLMLVNYRPEYRHEWSNRGYYAQLRLDPLGREGAEEMLDELLASPAPAGSAAGANRERPLADIYVGERVRVRDGIAALKRLIIERTEGNPFFMEETVQMLLDQGALVRDGAVKLMKPLGDLHIPPTVQAILTSRIDRLPAAQKELLQTLATMGKEFPLSLISRITGMAGDELDRILAGLQHAEFIYEQPAIPDVEYTFKHALTQEVAYNSLLMERRKVLHERTGEALESLFSDRLEDHVDDLAHHYGRSANTAKAVEYLRRAGEQATARSAFQEAENRLNAALELVPKLQPESARDAQELAVRMALVAPLNATRFMAAQDLIANLERARELCQGAGELVLMVEVLGALQWSYWSRGELRAAHELAEQALEIAARGSDELATFLAHNAAGSTTAFRGEFSKAREHFERALRVGGETLAVIAGDRALAGFLVDCVANLGPMLWALGYPTQALRQYERVDRLISGQIDLVARAAGMAHMLFGRSILLREYRGMREHAQALIALSRENGFLLYLACGLLGLGGILVEEGNPTEGIEMALDGMRSFRAGGETAFYALVSGYLVRAYLRAGRASEGLAVVEEGARDVCRAGTSLLRGRDAPAQRRTPPPAGRRAAYGGGKIVP